MLRLRSILLALALLLILPLLGAMAWAAFVLWDLPPAQGERIRGPHGLIGVQAGGSYVWVVPVGDDQVVLVDAGVDKEASTVRAEVREREVLAVLLTHAHPEQVVGLSALQDIPVHVGEGDLPLLTGEVGPSGWLAGLYAPLLPKASLSVEPEPVADGATLRLGTGTFRAVHVPGHTAGSVAWLWEDVLFTGGALLASSPLRTSPAALSADAEEAERSLEQLLPLDFDKVADGHTGIVSNARADLHRLLGAQLTAPEVRLRGPQHPSPTEGPDIEQEGLYVEALGGAADGSRPGLLVLDSGEEWVLARQAPEEWRPLVGRRVVVRGRLLAPEARPGLPAGLLVEVAALERAAGEGDEPAPRVVRTKEQLTEAAQLWVRVEGTVEQLEPLARGAARGEGRLVLPDGTTVLLSAALGLPLGEPVALLARVTETRDGWWAVADRLCDDEAPCP